MLFGALTPAGFSQIQNDSVIYLEAIIREQLSTDPPGHVREVPLCRGHLGMAGVGSTSDGLEDTAGFQRVGAGRTDALRPSCW